ncbi:MAG: glycosyltransferase family 4 protein [Bacteroidetes bacterium]|nr:glycosyltransferase family 4 protein [Bacteroidota bacterium]
MSTKKVTLVYSLKNTFVQRDIALLEKMGYQVLTLQAPPVKHFFGFLWNRLREFFLGFFRVLQSQAVFSWFNDYHTTAPLFWSKVFGKPFCILVGGYDAVSSNRLKHGIFLKKNFRQRLARWNYTQAKEIWVVHKSLEEGCSAAKSQEGTESGIRYFIPNLKTNIRVVPTAYDSKYWKRETPKQPHSILTVANISDTRTFHIKGIPLFLRLAKALPDHRFTIAGIKNLEIHKVSFPDNINLIGTLDSDALIQLYSQHHFYFQGSKIEGLPNVLCEAMLCECIPIGTNVFGIPEAIGDTGFIFNETEGLENVCAFVKEFEDNLDAGRLARKRIEKKYPLSFRTKAFQTLIKQAENV